MLYKIQWKYLKKKLLRYLGYIYNIFHVQKKTNKPILRDRQNRINVYMKKTTCLPPEWSYKTNHIKIDRRTSAWKQQNLRIKKEAKLMVVLSCCMYLVIFKLVNIFFKPNCNTHTCTHKHIVYNETIKNEQGYNHDLAIMMTSQFYIYVI